MYEPITLQRLDDFITISKDYDTLLRKKHKILEKVGSIKAIDYSKDRVQSGNGQKTSEPEHYAQALQKVNNEIKKYEAWLSPEREIIKNQIARIKKRDYRKLLVYRYIELWTWKEIAQELFEFEPDFWENEPKKIMNRKYWDYTMYYNRRAIAELEKISAKPYVKANKQLHLI